MEIQNTFIYLLGFAGTGKLTIATELQKSFPSILVDNHSVLNVLFRLIDTDGVTPLNPKIWDLALNVRAAVLETIRDVSKPDRNFIFTNELLADSEIDARLFQEVEAVARARGALLFPVRLLLSTDELCRRVASPERKSKMKQIDPISVRQKSESKKLFIPACDHFNLEVTNLTAEQSASAIIANLKSRNHPPRN